MNLILAKQIEQRFPDYLSYGVMPNLNEKYQKLGYRTLIVAVFPYYYPEKTGLFSKYCSVHDYHTVVKQEFDAIFSPLGVEYLSFSDISPFREKLLAEELGLGQIGEHNLLLTKRYGSFVFLGEVLLKEELPEKRYPKVSLCTACGACRKACPTHSLEQGFCKETCLSYLTQKKQLTPDEENLLKQGNTLWGCDLCQLACPVSQKAMQTQMEPFKAPVLQLSEQEILAMSEEEFQNKYAQFAFAYKGVEILKRNVRLLNEKQIQSN